ncbi:hypothetical protein [Metabacillus lacus]|uniref:hypothetical protein n=1 Tax=Metabacillus lacus TaxID=1983721 RepID=UPI001BA85125|nr:hypothetical protein [Metabacillus lacus]
MAVFKTGPIDNNTTDGNRPTQSVTAVIINTSQTNAASILIQGYFLNGNRTQYVSELFRIEPNQVINREFFADFDGFEYIFTTGGSGEEGVELSIWGKNEAGEIVAAHRLVYDELVRDETSQIKLVNSQAIAGIFLPLNNSVTVLTAPAISTVDGERLIITAFSQVDITTSASSTTPSYNISFELFRDHVPISFVSITSQDEFVTPITRSFTEIPSLTWVDNPPQGDHVYNVRITVTGTGLESAIVETRSLIVTRP